jgi:N-acetylneuraminic acid mutarotase
MLVWGGFGGIMGNDTNRNDGAAYNPETDSWRPIPRRNAPAARFDHSAVWTGKEMLVWGGYTDSHARYGGGHAPGFLNSGGRYDPATDTWRPISRQGAPSPRCWNSAVWTGTEMIIWGGSNESHAFNGGARYDPLTDTWKPMNEDCPLLPRGLHLAVWAANSNNRGCPGGEMLVWGGASRDPRNEADYFQDGARYNPGSDSWTPISSLGAPRGRLIAKAVWTGSEMVFWGGVNDAQDGGAKLEGRYPGTGKQADSPAPRASRGNDSGRFVGSGGRYNPATDSWTQMSSDGAPTPRLVTGVVWTGTGLLLSGGYNGTHLNDTFAYALTVAP